jgi:hypothetical protein
MAGAAGSVGAGAGVACGPQATKARDRITPKKRNNLIVRDMFHFSLE